MSVIPAKAGIQTPAAPVPPSQGEGKGGGALQLRNSYQDSDKQRAFDTGRYTAGRFAPPGGRHANAGIQGQAARLRPPPDRTLPPTGERRRKVHGERGTGNGERGTGNGIINSNDPEGNLIIHGDNLHALKALLPRYAGRVKCIYIDPPYNTGHEGWAYSDKVNSPMIREWLKANGPVDGEDLERHDKWLCMMWPRLHLLKELLSDDGVIFVSIDDNEQHHLRMMMDEIFGAENFIESFVWRSRLGRGATSKHTASLHEYVVSYAQNIGLARFRPENRTRKEDSRERLRQWGQGDRREDRPTMYYPIESEEFGEVFPVRPDGTAGRWRVSNSTMEDLFERGLVEFEKQTDGRVEAYKVIPAGTETSIAYPSMLDAEKVRTTAHGSIELKSVFNSSSFAYPKPSHLVKEIVSLCTEDGGIILDSFAGSGTTAHAVLALNKEDGGNRKFILVECEDYADSITAERVRRVIRGVPGAKDKALREGLGSSFTYYTLGDPIDVEGMLTGEALPEYSELAAYLLHTASGLAADGELQAQNGDGLFYQNGDTDYYLLYQPSMEWLLSNEALLNEEQAKRIHAAGRRAVVFAADKHMSQRYLSDMGITFCQIPYELNRLG